MLRTETRASSALCPTTLTYSLRRSCVSSGMTTRMTLPSLAGFAPMSELRSAFSMSLRAERSYGVMSSVRASGFWKEASCWSGVGVP